MSEDERGCSPRDRTPIASSFRDAMGEGRDDRSSHESPSPALELDATGQKENFNESSSIEPICPVKQPLGASLQGNTDCSAPARLQVRLRLIEKLRTLQAKRQEANVPPDEIHTNSICCKHLTSPSTSSSTIDRVESDLHRLEASESEHNTSTSMKGATYIDKRRANNLLVELAKANAEILILRRRQSTLEKANEECKAELCRLRNDCNEDTAICVSGREVQELTLASSFSSVWQHQVPGQVSSRKCEDNHSHAVHKIARWILGRDRISREQSAFEDSASSKTVDGT